MSAWPRDSFVNDFGLDPARVVAIGGGAELLRAFADVRAAVPGAELWIVGRDLTDPPEGVTSFGLISRATGR